MIVSLKTLNNVVEKAIASYGYSENEIRIIKEVMLYAQLRGNNQGIVKLIGKGIPKSPEAGTTEILRETKLSALLNGNHQMGMLVISEAMTKAISKARKHGFGIVGTNNTASSTGAIGYYAHKIAEQGLIGFVFAGSPETVAMHGSYEPIFGTNPIAIGIPSSKNPLVLDMATAAMAYFGLIEAKTAGRSIPGDIAYDEHGNLTTDPAKAMDGALRSFDKSYKSAGLAMMVEILTGPLVAASFVGIGDTAKNWGNSIYCIDPSLLVDPEEFKKNVSSLIAKVKSTKKLAGVKEIYAPGERGDNLTHRRLKEGTIEIEDNLYNEVLNISLRSSSQ